MGLVGSQVGCLPGRSIIPGGIPGGIPPISGGIPPGINLGSQVGLAGSRLTFLPGLLSDSVAWLDGSGRCWMVYNVF